MTHQDIPEHLPRDGLTGVLGRAGLAGLSKAMIRVGAAALGFGDGAGEGAGTGALFDAPVAGAAHVGVHADPAVHADGQAPQALAAERALRVDAPAVHADPGRLALVDVWGRTGTGVR